MELQSQNTRSGFLFGIVSYIIWGLAPLYFKLIEHVPPEEILSHRIIWSALLLFIVIAIFSRWPILFAILRKPKKLILLLMSALLIGINWFIYLNAIQTDQLLAASLGYYITPLSIILLAILFLNERLSLWQILAVGLAAMGVIILIVAAGTIPWVAIGLAISFSFYSIIRKYANVDALTGLLVETVILTPIAIFYLFGSAESQTGALLNNGWYLNILLLCAGIITTLPLLFYAEATVRMNLSTLGFLQYIAPSIMWLLAVFFFQEPITSVTLISFGFIWAGLACYTFDNLMKARRSKV